MVDPDMEPLVLDFGSGLTKVGFSGKDAPKCVFPTLVGRPKNPGIGMFMDSPDCFTGEEAIAKRGILRIKYPVMFGSVHNWNDWEKVLHHSFYNMLRVTPEEHPVLKTESPMNPIRNREKEISILFETFNVPAYYAINTTSADLFATGRVSGVVVTSGYSVTYTVPIWEGLTLKHGIIKNIIGGKEVTEYMRLYINKSKRGYDLSTSSERIILRELKEKHCFSTLNYDRDLGVMGINEKLKGKKKYSYEVLTYLYYYKNYKPLLSKLPIEVVNEIFSFENVKKETHSYVLPDNYILTLKEELFAAPEIMFNPKLCENEMPGIHEMCVKSINKCEEEMREKMYDNIVLSGGNTMFEGFDIRFEKELKKIVKKEKVKIHAPQKRDFLTFVGGSIYSSTSSFQNMWVTKDEYDDVYRKTKRPENDFIVAEEQYRLGTQFFERSQFNKAISCYKKAIKANPKHAKSYFNLATVLVEKNDINKAIECYQKAIECNLKEGNAHFALGYIYDIKQNELSKAVKCYRDAIKFDPKDADAYYNLGGVLEKQNKFEESMECYQNALKVGLRDAGMYDYLGSVFLKQNKVREAILCYENAIRLQPMNAEMFYNLGVIKFENENKLNEAISCFERAVFLNKKHSGPWNGLGRIYRQQNKPEKAIKCYKNAIECNPTNAQPYYNLGYVFQQQEKYIKAVECYKNSIKFNPIDANAHSNIGVCYESINNLKDALLYYEKAIKISPEDVEINLNLGNTYLKQEMYKEAIKCYKKAIQFSPNNSRPQQYASTMLQHAMELTK